MRKLVASCSAVLIAAALLAACGGGSSSKSGNPLTTSPGGGASSSNDSLSKLVADANKGKFKITFTDDSGNAQVYAQDGNGNSMFGTGDSTTFISKDATISCNKDSGKDVCTQSPASVGALGNPFVAILAGMRTYFTALGGKLGDTSSRKIAGRDATCVTFSAKDLAGSIGGAIANAAGKSLKGSATYCIDKDTGAPLEISGSDDSGKSSTTLKVTKFETPSASDFTPPATPTTVPGLGSITLPGGGAITLPSIPGGG